MITTINPLRRVAVTLVLAGATALGAVAIAPAAFADDTTNVTQQGQVQQGQVTEVAPSDAPVAPEVVAPEVVVPAAPAPVVEQAPAPAPVVAPPVVVIGKDGKAVKQPKVCTDKDQKEYDGKLAKANQQAAPLLKLAAQLRAGAKALLAQVPNLTSTQAKVVRALAAVGDFAASKLEAQAQAIVANVGGIGCITVSVLNGRF
jgi:hypothetical protein